MIRISTVQLSVIPGNIRANFEQMEREIQNARKQNTDILIFPELCLSGYMIGDLWEQNAFLRECERYGQKIADAAENIIVIFGNIAVDPKKKNNDGRVRKYNAAFAACNGQFLKMTEGYLILLKRCSLITGNLMTNATLQAFLSWLPKKINPYLPCLRLLHLPSGRKLSTQALFFARTAGMKTHGCPLWKSFQKKYRYSFQSVRLAIHLGKE